MISKELQEWVSMQSKRLSRCFPSDTTREETLARLAKLTEETGELADEVLSSSGHQREEKLQGKDVNALSSEFADVLITTFLLAENMDVDISKALSIRIEKINERFEKLDSVK